MSNLFILLKNSFINSTGINSLSKGVSTSNEKKKLLITRQFLDCFLRKNSKMDGES